MYSVKERLPFKDKIMFANTVFYIAWTNILCSFQVATILYVSILFFILPFLNKAQMYMVLFWVVSPCSLVVKVLSPW